MTDRNPMMQDLAEEVVRQLRDQVEADRRLLGEWISVSMTRLSDTRGIAMALVYISRPEAPEYLLRETARIFSQPLNQHENLDERGVASLVAFLLHCFGFERSLANPRGTPPLHFVAPPVASS